MSDDWYADFKAAREFTRALPPVETRRCDDCGAEHTYTLVVDGRTRCAGCLSRVDDEAQWQEATA